MLQQVLTFCTDKLSNALLQFGRKTIEAEGKWNIHTPPLSENKVESNGTNGTTVISREDLILVPDPEQNYLGNNNLAVPVVLLSFLFLL